MRFSVLGAGAFGTALAEVLARAGGEVTLWGRDQAVLDQIAGSRSTPRLPDVMLSDRLRVTAGIDAASDADILLLAVPMQSLAEMLSGVAGDLADTPLVACCKGIDLDSGTGPAEVIERVKPGALPAILTGPSFAADIARGLPTALTLACRDGARGRDLQQALATPTLRTYRTTDVIGAELGGALKNVIAIACGACIGAGLGDSARAALMTRGFAEMTRLACHFGARTETLAGLSGLGDLALTCTSGLSRNFRYGHALSRNETFDTGVTVEGAATARAVVQIAARADLSLPISTAVAALTEGRADVPDVLKSLLSRPLKEE